MITAPRNRVLIHIGLIIAFSLCYMAWGKGQSATVAGMEYYLLFRRGLSFDTATHPVILAGLAGQICLIISAVRYNKIIQLAGVLLPGLIVLLVLLAGVLSGNILMIASTLPYLLLAVLLLRCIRRGEKLR